MSVLKYQKEIDENPSDFTGFQERELESFRWVFEDINDARNFLPIYILDEKRKNDDISNKSYKCIGYALSLFSSKKAAVQRLNEITNNKKFLFKKLGTHIACGTLNNSDGICDEPNESKHFSLFEFVEIDLKSKFAIIEKIVE